MEKFYTFNNAFTTRVFLKLMFILSIETLLVIDMLENVNLRRFTYNILNQNLFIDANYLVFKIFYKF